MLLYHIDCTIEKKSARNGTLLLFVVRATNDGTISTTTPATTFGS